ncbi:hypothetical protein SacmaDRAFT_2550 [Saccharomonospora marina XMU15]|uniref:AB hydrolase-1 domain-containing protein n=1 Tax=Saccharomonospora marina XMU15 TaxID=882083 RepID=H5WZR1_9PSEU|nr:alpha/beta fold hydrolase [Saccharomonospora marina]EHR50793.1 hypothetical protein SacmaDRAFT_2550 [Saccharomonospora marina XMU15]
MNPTVVLLHSPLVGPHTWRAVRAHLDAAGRRAILPDLRPPARPRPTPGRVAAAAAAAMESSTPPGPVTLACHSMAGMLLPGIAQATRRRVTGAVLVDSAMPRPGVTWFQTVPPELAGQLRDLAEDGRLPPWHHWFPPETLTSMLPDLSIRKRFEQEIPRLPLSFFDEPFPGKSGWAASIPVGYLLLSEVYRTTASQASALRWPVSRLDLHHLAPVSHPETVTDAILAVLGELHAGSR